jgi:hypothetical protein
MYSAACCLYVAHAGPPGAKKSAPKQNLFLIYVDALSLVNSKRAAKSTQLQDITAAEAAAGGQQDLEQQLQLQRQLSVAASAAPNMPDFTLKDLQFILTFTGRSDFSCTSISLVIMWLLGAANMPGFTLALAQTPALHTDLDTGLAVCCSWEYCSSAKTPIAPAFSRLSLHFFQSRTGCIKCMPC